MDPEHQDTVAANTANTEHRESDEGNGPANPAGESAPAGGTPAADATPAEAALTVTPPVTPEQPKPPRFTVRATEKSGPVQAFAGVQIGDDGVGTTNNPGIAYHCVMGDYEVLDGENENQPYTGAPPKKKPVNGDAAPAANAALPAAPQTPAKG